MRMYLIAPVLVTMLYASSAQPPQTSQPASQDTQVRLDRMTWQAAEDRLHAKAIVVLPLGAGAKQHGRHLPLDTDKRLAEYLARRLGNVPDIVVAPTVPYHSEEPFQEYPGSTSIAPGTARDLLGDIVRSLARHGPRRFYVVNTGTSTASATAAASALAREGVLLRATDVRARLASVIRSIQKQPHGNHADEIETSMMLYADPAAVDMTVAARELAPESSPFRLSRRVGSGATYSPSGVWGDATIATRDKGETLVEALVAAIKADIEELRRTALPIPGPASADVLPAPTTAGPPRGRTGRPDECLLGDDRTIRAFGPAFTLAWRNQDAEQIATLWAPGGDMAHPDGYVEGTAQIIRQNRASLFMRREYRGSTHPLVIGQIRCITADVAIADARWELRGVTGTGGERLPPMEGLSTLVLRKSDGSWRIEAYRYTISETQNVTRPALLPRPGPTVIR